MLQSTHSNDKESLITTAVTSRSAEQTFMAAKGRSAVGALGRWPAADTAWILGGAAAEDWGSLRDRSPEIRAQCPLL
jgi:hypothetical protein